VSLEIRWRRGIAQLVGTLATGRVRESLRTRDPEIAKIRAAERQARLVRAEVYGVDHEATFADVALDYMKGGGEARYLAPIIKALGKTRLKDIKPGHIRDLAQQLKPKAKASTRNRHVVVPARSVINFGAERGLCAAMRVKGFKEAAVEKQAVDRAWLDKFRANAVHHRLATLALFNFTTGARIGEAVALTPDDFNLDAKKARIDTTKNGDYRYFYLTDELVRELRLIEPRKVKDGSVRMFGYSSPNACIWAWKETCKRAAIPYVTRHEAGRHSAGTETIIRNGVDPVTAAALLGWKDPKVLLKRYVHPEKLNDVAEKVFGLGDRKVTRLRKVSDRD
jgi:integrase